MLFAMKKTHQAHFYYLRLVKQSNSSVKKPQISTAWLLIKKKMSEVKMEIDCGQPHEIKPES